MAKLRHHKYYTNSKTETSMLVPNAIEHRVAKHVYGKIWLAIHRDAYAIITAHANDIRSPADGNRYHILRAEIDVHNAEHAELKIIMGIDANTTLPSQHPLIGPHTAHVND